MRFIPSGFLPFHSYEEKTRRFDRLFSQKPEEVNRVYPFKFGFYHSVGIDQVGGWHARQVEALEKAVSISHTVQLCVLNQ